MLILYSYAFETLVLPEMGVNLMNLSALCPGSCSVVERAAEAPAAGGPEGEEAASASADLLCGEDGVAEHLAALLVDRSGAQPESAGQCSVQVIGDEWYLVLQVRAHGFVLHTVYFICV